MNVDRNRVKTIIFNFTSAISVITLDRLHLWFKLTVHIKPLILILLENINNVTTLGIRV